MCQERSSTSRSPSRQPSVRTEAMPPPLTLLGSVITCLRWHISDKRQGTPLPLSPDSTLGSGALEPSIHCLAISFFPEHPSLMVSLHIPLPGTVPAPEEVLNKCHLA